MSHNGKVINGKVEFPCDFCGKFSHEVDYLVKGPLVGICDGCVELAFEIVKQKKSYIEFLRQT